MAPPARRPAEAHQAGRLGGDAVRGDELLLLADGVHEVEGVNAEAEQSHERDRQQRSAGGERQLQALARPPRREHEERQHQAGGDLDADAGGQRRCAGAHLRARRTDARRQRQRCCQGEHHQRVVVRARDREQHQHRVQADKRRRPPRRLPEPARSASDQCHRAEAREHRDHLECPHCSGRAERHQRVAEEREHRPVRRVLKRPADEVEDRVGWRFGSDVRVRVKPVQDTQAREREIAEHVL